MAGEFCKILFLDSAGSTSKNLANGSASFMLDESFGGYNRAMIACASFSFTNYFINVSVALGNNLLYFSDEAANLTKYTITIPSGSYSVADLNTFLIADQLAKIAVPIVPVAPATLPPVGSPFFHIVPLYAQNRLAIQWENTGATSPVGWYIHFGAASPFVLMGFALLGNYPATQANTAGEFNTGPNIPVFNNITTVRLATNLTSDSVGNTGQSPVLVQTAPTVPVGSAMQYDVNNLMWIKSTQLEDKVSEIRLQLLDQNNTPINLAEDFSCTLIVKN